MGGLVAYSSVVTRCCCVGSLVCKQKKQPSCKGISSKECELAHKDKKNIIGRVFLCVVCFGMK